MANIEPLLGKRLALACDQKNIPAWGRNREIGKRLNVSPAAVSKWLNDKSRPTTSKLFELAHFLEVTPEWLASGKGPMRPIDGPTSQKLKEAIDILQSLDNTNLDSILNILRAMNK